MCYNLDNRYIVYLLFLIIYALQNRSAFTKGKKMNSHGYAYFILHPRIMEDLLVLHDVQDEQPYEIVKEIGLQAIDFDNFAADLTVERQYIEDNAYLCGKCDVWKVLLIRGRNPGYGVLVLPETNGYVGWAAYSRE